MFSSHRKIAEKYFAFKKGTNTYVLTNGQNKKDFFPKSCTWRRYTY